MLTVEQVEQEVVEKVVEELAQFEPANQSDSDQEDDNSQFLVV